MTETIGVLLMAYGGPDSLDDIPAFLLDIRGGRPTSQELIDEITANYRQIGGKSPLLDITRRQAALVEAKLNAGAPPGVRYKTYIGMRHWTPRIKDAVDQMIADGVQQAVALVLAPHYSGMSIAKYFEKLDEALARTRSARSPTTPSPVTTTHPLYLEALAQRVSAGLGAYARRHAGHLQRAQPARAHHRAGRSVRRATARNGAARRGQSRAERMTQWTFSYQSAGRSPEPWLGPQIQDYVIELAEQGHTNLLSCVVGFVADHVEDSV